MSYKLRPIKEVNENDMIVGSMPPVHRLYPFGNAAGIGPYPPAVAGSYPPVAAAAAGPVPVPYPVIKKQTVYAPNPFYGYQQGEYKPDAEIVESSDPYHRSRGLSTIITATPTSWKSQLNSAYSQRISSMSIDASMMSASFSAQMQLMKSKFSVKEASLRSKLSSKSATRTTTWRRHDDWN